MAKILEVQELIKYYPVKVGVIFQRSVGQVQAVDKVSFTIEKGQTLGLVGESGCGKTTTARVILRLIEATSGRVLFQGEDILRFSGQKLRRMRKEMQIIFQDPFASLNPRMTIGDIISEPLIVHSVGTRMERRRRTQELLKLVGLNPEHFNRYPHEFSGGQRQRIGIARALALKPKLIICDEPVSALDVSIQAQILNLLEDLQKEFNLTYLFIAHDLSVVRHICDQVAVMYLGKVMEMAERDALYREPNHPYTQSLLSAVPIPDPEKERRRTRIILQGDIPSPLDPPPACRFHTRCPIAQEVCRELEPELRLVAENHYAACHFAKVNPIPI